MKQASGSASECKTLGFIGGPSVCECTEGAFIHRSTGCVLEQLTHHYDRILLCTSVVSGRRPEHDYRLPPCVKVEPVPAYRSSRDALLCLPAIRRAYRRAVQRTDHIFIRGMCPGIGAIYHEARKQGKRPLHWLVGNPVALLQSHIRDGWLTDRLGIAYSNYWERTARRGNIRSNGAFICNGREIYDRVSGITRYLAVSSSILEEEFYYRQDTCRSERVRLTCICYVRPEKGVEYLVQALALIKTSRPVELFCVGSRNRYPAYQAKLDAIVRSNGLAERIHFPGHASADQVREALIGSDIFVLPTLSEGTPRVLVEARAYGVPIIATNVGGIPTSVSNGKDGLLVPPKDVAALAEAIDRVIEDDDLRRHLIVNGYATARELTVDRFAKQVVEILNGQSAD